jgi:DNA-directed RNA polymerase beta' subunit
MSYSDAYDMWYRAQIKINPRVKEIIQSLIDSSCNGRGLPVLINRNPTLGYGSILQSFVVGMTDSFVMKLPLRVLSMMNADFDGDALNILHIINEAFFVRAYEIYNPRTAMQISRNDGRFNGNVCPQRDTLLGVNTFSNLGRSVYTEEDMQIFEQIQAQWQNLIV